MLFSYGKVFSSMRKLNGKSVEAGLILSQHIKFWSNLHPIVSEFLCNLPFDFGIGIGTRDNP